MIKPIKEFFSGIPLWFWILITPFLLPIIILEIFSWLGAICDVLIDRYKKSLLILIEWVIK